MKKLWMTVTVLFIGTVLLSACVQTEPERESSTFETVNTLVGLTASLEADTLSTTGAVINYTNQTEHELTYGEAYILEEKVDGDWYQVPYLDEDGVAFIEIAYILPPESASEWTADWEEIYGPLEPGDYRLVKDFLIVAEPGNYDTHHIATEFHID